LNRPDHRSTWRRRWLGALVGLAAAATVGAQTVVGRDAVLQAIQRDDPHALRTALLRGADPDLRDELGSPAIVIAARNLSWRVVTALAELRGTDVDAAGPEGTTALMFAALHGETALVRALVARGAQVNKTDWAPLHFAAANGHSEIVRFLLEEHAYIDAESPNRTTPLMMATRQGHPTTVRLLVAEGADPTIRNQAGLTAADYARAGGDTRLAEWLTQQAEAFRRRYPLPAAPSN
jgi:ankyrin repeat protein